MKEIGDIYIHPNCGECKVIDIQNNQYLIEFENTLNRIWCSKDRAVRHHFYDNTIINDLRIGDVYETVNFGKVIIINQIKNEYTVKFEKSGFITTASRQQIIFGQIFDKLQPSYSNIGIFGIGKWKYSDDIYYHKWTNLLRRCYIKSNNRYKNYGALGITVCDEFKNYQNFCNWIETNFSLYKNFELSELEIDKDILANINKTEYKEYSPKTCLLIPSEINCFLAGDKLGTGVYNRENKVIFIDIKYKGERIIESFDYSIEGFIEAKIRYATLKYTLWIDLLNKFNIPIYIKDILKNYDFSFNWKFKNLKEENLDEILSK